MPLWAVWVDGRVMFSTGRESRKAKNLAHDPHVVVTTEDGNEAVIVEGTAARVDMDDAFVDAYRAKYDFDIRTMSDEPVFAVTASRVIALDEPRFTTTATRWTL